MMLLDPGRKKTRLLPGHWHATRGGEVLITTLGSCIATCLRDDTTGIAGMNHFMLPGAFATSSLDGAEARYGIQSMELLINDMLKLGAARYSLKAKVFGGASMIECIAGARIGEHNAFFAMDFLCNEKIPIIATDVLGTAARKVVYDTDSGQTFVMRIDPLDGSRIARMELQQSQNSTVPSGSVELFS